MMSNTFFIKGTITIEVTSSADATIRITPSAGFVTPDKTPKGIAFPDQVNVPTYARIIDLNKGYPATEVKDHIPALIAIVSAQKPIQLHLEEISLPTATTLSDLKLIGFVYPAP